MNYNYLIFKLEELNLIFQNLNINDIMENHQIQQ